MTRNKGFTLAEILITLLIVGIVASLTIPALVNNVNKDIYVTELKKTYNDLQQAFNLVQLDNSGSIVPVFENDTITNLGNGAVLNAFLTKLNYIKNCGNSMGCWYDTPLYNLNGSVAYSQYDTSLNGLQEKALLTNGIPIRISIYNINCTATGWGSGGTGPLLNKTCGFISVDVNGFKGPNKYGRDYFYFWVTQSGIYPHGSFNDGYSCNVSPGDGTNSKGCAAKVLTEGDMNY